MSSSERFETHVRVEDVSLGPVELLCAGSGLSKTSIKDAMTKGAVWHTRGRRTQRLRRAKRRLEAGDELHLYFDPDVLAEIPAEPRLIDDAGACSVWHKPYGLRSQGSKWGDHCTVVRWAEQQLERPAWTVHRLDRAASGLIVVAHSKRAAAALSRQFREREVEKRYRVRVHGAFPESPMTVDTPLDGKPSVSHFRRIGSEDSTSWVEVHIETGRKHQVRRHLAGIGYPVVGDRLYGSGGDDGEDLQLTATELGFAHPDTGEPLTYRLEE